MPHPAEAASPSPRPRISSVVARLTALGFPSAIAGHLPSRHWLVDLPACFPVQAGAALLLGTVVLFLARRPWLGSLWLLGALAASWSVLPAWFAAGPGGPGGSGALSILALNLQRGSEPNADAAIARIREAEADVVFLSELTPRWLAALGPALADYPHRHLEPDAGYFGLALFSRLPLRAATIPLAFEWAPAVRAILDTPGGPVGLLGIHTPRPGRGDRCAERDAALAAIPAALATLPARHLVIGDFNATPWNGAFRELLAATGLHHASGDTFRPTWPANWPWPLRIPIDHLLVTAGIGVEGVTVSEAFGSDHAPLLARLRL